MQTSIEPNRIRKLTVLALASVGLLISCGAEQIAGIQGSGVTPANASATTVGPITAFGSIFVNGVEYSTSSAQITVNGQSATEADLRVGQIVTVKGSLGENDETGSATEVIFIGDARGPVTQIDTSAETFIVLGQTVQVTDNTLFDEAIEPAGVEGLQEGAVVEVSAFRDASGDLVASRIDLKSQSVALQVKGPVETLDTNARTFRINALSVNYGGITPDGDLSNGAAVQVKGTASSATGPLQATSVKVLPSQAANADEHGNVQGLVSSYTSDTDFVVEGQRITTDAATEFDLNGQTLGLNVLVKVKGRFNNAGVLMADEVEIRSGGPNANANGSGNGSDGNNNEGDSESGNENGNGGSQSGAGNSAGGNGNDNSNGNGNSNVNGNGNGNSGNSSGNSSNDTPNGTGIESANRAQTRSDIARSLIDSISGGSLTVLGVKIATNSDTTFNDKSQQRLRTMRMNDLRVGDYVEVRGVATSNGLRATLIERDDAENHAYLQGTARNLDTSGFEVFGVEVTTDAQTRFLGIKEGTDELLEAISGRQVKVRGSFSGGVLHADQVQLRN